MKRAPLVLMALNWLVWGGLAYMGWDLLQSVAARHVAGSPSAGQFGYYVALPSGGGNYGQRPYSTNVYKVTDLTRPAIVVESGAYPQAIGFDINAGFLYAQNRDFPLIVFNSTGLKLKEYKLAPRGGGSTQQFLVDPEGRKLLVLTEKSVDSIELPGKE